LTPLKSYEIKRKNKFTELRIKIGSDSSRIQIEQKFFELINYILQMKTEGKGN